MQPKYTADSDVLARAEFEYSDTEDVLELWEGDPTMEEQVELQPIGLGYAPDSPPVGPEFTPIRFAADAFFPPLSLPPRPEVKQAPEFSPMTVNGQIYRFDFGPYEYAYFRNVLAADEAYIKELGEMPQILDRWDGGLRAAFEFYCPHLISDGNTPNPTQTDTDIDSYNANSHPKDYVFTFGRQKGKRFDEVPEADLNGILSQVMKSELDKPGLREAFKWHGWLGWQWEDYADDEGSGQ
jgi:hypothetical protein